MARKFKDITHEYNSDFEKLISDHSHNQLHSVCNYTVIRPAYAYTSQCFNEYWRDGVTPGYYAAKPKKDGSTDKQRSDKSEAWLKSLDKS